MFYCSKDKKHSTYSGQAIVIAMVVIVISVIIGLGVLSRTLRDKRSATVERYSSEALEISDSLINIFSTVETSKLFGAVDLEGKNGEIKRIESLEDLVMFLRSLDLEADVSSLFNVCSGSESGVTVVMSVIPGEEVELLESSTIGYRLKPLSVQSDCKLSFNVEPRGVSSVGLIIQKIYGRGYPNAVEYKDYEMDDTLSFCVSETSECTNTRLVDSTWALHSKSTPIVIDLKEEKNGNMLDTVRITPIGGTAGILATLSRTGCSGDLTLEMLKIAVTTTCEGESRGKQVLVPKENNLGYSTLFDFVFYNNQGFFQPY